MTETHPELRQNLKTLRNYLVFSFMLATISWGAHYGLNVIPASTLILPNHSIEYSFLLEALSIMTLLASLLCLLLAGVKAFRYICYKQVQNSLQQLLSNQDLNLVRSKIETVNNQAVNAPLNQIALDSARPFLRRHLDKLTQRSLEEQLNTETNFALQECDQRLSDIKNQIPLIKAETSLRKALSHLQQRRQQLAEQWEQTYAGLSWWNKLTVDGPDFEEMDGTIRQMEEMHTRLLKAHVADFALLDMHLKHMQQRARQRISFTGQYIEQYIKTQVNAEQETIIPLKAGLWLSALSMPVSAWSDATAAGNIYETLRQVNGNYASMSDSEIWWATLFMPSEQWVGLASLTKGAYFEQLVAADTGGTLHEHFNNPGSDIVIDGVSYQIKATDSAAYINTVDPAIPVLATTEISEISRAIDAGYSNAELDRSIELALGGSVIDVKDTAADAVMAGVGGLGLFATLQGVNHAADKFNNGGDGVEAIFDGVGVAIEGTARALVGTAEIGYKALASRPSRFVGRTLLAGLVKLDEKVLGDESKSK